MTPAIHPSPDRGSTWTTPVVGMSVDILDRMTLIHTMKERGAKLGLATMCIGAGQGIATIYEAV
jgi:hypothetical protein